MFKIDSNTIHCWQIDLEDLNPDLYLLLSKEEKYKADKFARIELKNRYSQSRVGLRIILGKYLNIQPENVEIVIPSSGKPEVMESNLKFNIAHTSANLLVGISTGEPIGVDIEKVISRKFDLDIQEKYFKEPEKEWIRSCDLNSKDCAFIQIWSCKEALLKERAKGVSHITELNSINFLIDKPPPYDEVKLFGREGSSEIYCLPTIGDIVSTISTSKLNPNIAMYNKRLGELT